MEKWDRKTIEERFDRVARRFTQIWKFPDVPFEEAPYEEVNIFDAEDPTYKKLEYAVFFDQKLPFRYVSNLYEYVLQVLFEMEPEAFFSPDLVSKLTLAQDPTQLRQALKISDTYYVESNLDSRNKFERIKMLLSLFGLEDELSVKYGPVEAPKPSAEGEPEV